MTIDKSNFFFICIKYCIDKLLFYPNQDKEQLLVIFFLYLKLNGCLSITTPELIAVRVTIHLYI